MGLDGAGRTIGQAVRRLRRAPGFALAAVVTLGLGIGANTAVFSVVDAVLLKPLPYPHASRLVGYSLDSQGQREPDFTLAQFQFLQRYARATENLAGYRGMGTVQVAHDGTVSWADGLQVTGGFFRVLGAQVGLGRAIGPADNVPRSATAVVLSYGFWQRAFGASPQVVGERLTLDGQPGEVVGIAPRGFRFQEQPVDFYAALPFDDSLTNSGYNTAAIGRLRADMSLRQAQAQAAVLAQAMRAASLLPTWARTLEISSYQELEAGSTSGTLWLLLGAVEVLLLIACANVAGLVLARALARRPEIAVRRALGASTRDLLADFLAEGFVLGGLGAATGVAIAAVAARTLVARLPWDIRLAEPIGLDWRVLGFALAAGIAVSLVFALASLSQTRGAAAVPGRYEKPARARYWIMVGEVALALVLLVSAALLVESLRNMLQQPLGFNPRGATLFHTQLPVAAAPGTAAAWQFDRQVMAALEARPGAVAIPTNMPPLAGHNNLPSQRADRPQASLSVEIRVVGPGFFRAMGIPLLAGRAFTDADGGSAPAVAIVDGKLARRWFGGDAALGGQVRLGAWRSRIVAPALAALPRTVVGVVGEVKSDAMTQPALATIYVPAAQLAGGGTWWVVRGGGWTQPGLRQAVTRIAPEVRITGMQPYSAMVAATLARPNFEAGMAGAFALLALALTAVGLYGLLTFLVARRRREIGIRIALGARPRQVAAQVTRQGMALVGAGIALGLAAALAWGRLMAGLLYGVRPGDPAALAAAAGLLAVVALGACTLPALRAARVDPAQTLRNE